MSQYMQPGSVRAWYDYYMPARCADCNQAECTCYECERCGEERPLIEVEDRDDVVGYRATVSLCEECIEEIGRPHD